MTTSDDLRKAGRYIRKHGFSPRWDEISDRDCGCFLHAIECAGGGGAGGGGKIYYKLSEIVGNFSTPGLLSAGWTKDATLDAYAACMIAADLCEP